MRISSTHLRTTRQLVVWMQDGKLCFSYLIRLPDTWRARLLSTALTYTTRASWAVRLSQVSAERIFGPSILAEILSSSSDGPFGFVTQPKNLNVTKITMNTLHAIRIHVIDISG